MTEQVRPAAVIVLAAGSGTRMKSKTMKVLHPLCGRSMIGHVLTAALSVQPERVVAVVGHGREQVGPHVLEHAPGALLAVQETQEGTGHAVRMGLDALRAEAGTTRGTVLVMAGDTPLLEGATLAALVADHARAGRGVTVLTAEVPDPFGYGRVIRDDDGSVTAIVEQKDATDQQAAVREINSGVFAFDGEFLADALSRIGNDNAQGRVLPHRCRRHRPRRRRAGRRAPDRRRDPDRGRQRPGPARRARRRAEPSDPGPLDARRCRP